MTRRLLLALVALTALGLAREQAPRAEAPTLTVLAAASLTESLQAVAARWTAAGHPAVTFSFDASSKLAKQIEAGAPADAFFSADADWMDHLAAAGLIDPASRVNLLGNTLVAVVPRASTLAVSGPRDLASPEIKRLALAGENVPAGRYAAAALQSAGVWESVSGRVVRGDNVRSVLAWVARGEAEAGVVYGTDARVDPAVRVAWTFAAGSYPPIVYPAAVIRGAAHASEAADLLRFCQSAEALGVFYAAGFTPAPTSGP